MLLCRGFNQRPNAGNNLAVGSNFARQDPAQAMPLAAEGWKSRVLTRFARCMTFDLGTLVLLCLHNPLDLPDIESPVLQRAVRQ